MGKFKIGGGAPTKPIEAKQTEPQKVAKPVEKIVEVIKEVPVERIVEKPVEVIKEVIKRVPVEKIVHKEVIKEVPVERIVEKVVKEIVYVDKPFEIVKHVPVEVIKEVEKEVKIIQRIVPKWAMMIAAMEFAIIILLLMSRS